MHDQRVEHYHHSESAEPTAKTKLGCDAQGRIAWEVTVDGHTSVSEMAMALDNAVAAVQAQVARLQASPAQECA